MKPRPCPKCGESLALVRQGDDADHAAVAWLREIDAGTDNACVVVCSKGDPGSFPVFMAADQPEALRDLSTLFDELLPDYAESTVAANARAALDCEVCNDDCAGAELLEAALAVSKIQADFKLWAEAGVMRGLLSFTEADLRKASTEAFAALNAAIAKATGAA